MPRDHQVLARCYPSMALVAVVAALAAAGVALVRHERHTSMPIMLYATAENLGYVNPCGCSKGQYGGLARRATRLKTGDGICIDLGNLVMKKDPLGAARLSLFHTALSKMGYVALVPGTYDLKWMESLHDQAFPVPVTAVNLALRRSGTRPFRDPVWVNRRGVDIAIIGVVGTRIEVPPEYSIIEPTRILERVVQRARQRSDYVVLAVHGSGKETIELARLFPDVDVAVGRTAGEGAFMRSNEHRPPVLLVGEKAQYVGYSTMDGSATGGLSWLDDSIPDDPTMASFVRESTRSLNALDPTAIDEIRDRHRAAGFRGSVSCAQCHSREWDNWRATRHATAMWTLAQVGSDRTRECAACHLVDRRDDTDDALLMGVGCEACHGTARHELSSQGRLSVCTPRSSARARAVCKTCHDPEHSAAFDTDLYVSRILCAQR